jgi:dTDP-4-dehydrorhamnose 3,5-epimerase
MKSFKEYNLPGVRVLDIDVIPDERGFFAEAIRRDWKNFTDDEGDDNGWIVQGNISYSYPGMIRAWHRHVRGQIDNFVVLKGAMKICAFDDEEGSPTRGSMVEIVASASKPQVVRIPGKYWHGTKTVSSEPSLTFYLVNKLYDYKQPDELRRPWNDDRIIPLSINGNQKDPRVNKPWDWNYPPHK